MPSLFKNFPRAGSFRSRILMTMISALVLPTALAMIACGESRAQSPSGVNKTSPSKSTAKAPADRVVLLMLDGVRRREFFQGVNAARLKKSLAEETIKLAELRERTTARGRLYHESVRAPIAPGPHAMPFFRAKHMPAGLVYGRPGSGTHVWLANSVIYSLPAYRSIFSGYSGDCFSNGCGRIDVETFPERIAREFGLGMYDVAAIASWIKMDFAVTRGGKRIFVNTGTNLFPEFSSAYAAANDGMLVEPPPWGQARLDKFTFSHGLNYLKEKQPRFFYLSLNDADEWAHLDLYADYIRIIRQYDAWIDELIRVIDGLPGRTVLLMTTDHDRGSGRFFKNHGFIIDGAPIWLYARGPRGAKVDLDLIKTEGRDFFTHLDIRPTVEALLGLKPLTGPLRGKPLKAVLKLAKGE